MLEALNLHKRYGKTVAVDDISIRIERGEIVGLLGPNGAGKTTTFEMLLGFIRPDKGQINLDGKEITCMPIWKRSREGLLYLPQEISLFNKLTVENNMVIVLEEYYRNKKEQNEVACKYLKKMGLYELKEHIAGTLSGGEKRRLEIARSLSLNPKFFLLDEPFSGIDPKTVAELQDTIVGLKNEGIGILLTDHNVRDSLKITDRTYLINKGVIISAGSPEEILKHPDSKKVYFGENFRI